MKNKDSVRISVRLSEEEKKVGTLGGDMWTVTIRICAAVMQGQNTETETNKRFLGTA